MTRSLLATTMIASFLTLAPMSQAATAPALEPPVTLPIVFTSGIHASKAHAGDAIAAKTSQTVRLADGTVIPAGTKVNGHVLAASAFVYDKTPYAKQRAGELSIQFDALELHGQQLPLHVAVRAMADPLTSWGAREPKASDMDPQGTVTQIGGDQLTPSQAEVTNMDGDVVAYNRHGGVYAHLIASGHCDDSSVEVSVGIYSASACGLYGFTQMRALEMGSPARPSVLTLASSRTSPEVWKDSTALLEVLPAQ